MSAPYILLAGRIAAAALSVIAVRNNKQELINYAKDYAEAHPNSLVHIFSWEESHESKLRVDLERHWAPPEGYITESIFPSDKETQSDPTI